MGVLINLLNKAQDLLNLVRFADFAGPVLLRIYLVPVFFLAVSN